MKLHAQEVVPVTLVSESLTLRLWALYRTRPWIAIGAFLGASAAFGYATYEKVNLLFSLLPAAAVFVTVYNLLDLTQRVFDEKRWGLGLWLGCFCLAGVTAVAATSVVLFLKLAW